MAVSEKAYGKCRLMGTKGLNLLASICLVPALGMLALLPGCAPAGRPELQAAIEKACEPPPTIPNFGPWTGELHWRLGLTEPAPEFVDGEVLIDPEKLTSIHNLGWFTPQPEDLPLLRYRLHDTKLDIHARLCVAYWMIRLRDREGEDFLWDCLCGRGPQEPQGLFGAGSEPARPGPFLMNEYLAALQLSAVAGRADWVAQKCLLLLDEYPAESNQLLTMEQAVQALQEPAALRKPYRPDGPARTYDRPDVWGLLAISLGRSAVPILVRQVRDGPSDPDAVMALAYLDPRAAEPVLLETLMPDKTRFTRREVRALDSDLEMKNLPRDTPSLRRLLAATGQERAQAGPRGAQLACLAKMKNRQVVQLISDFLHREDVVAALVEIEGPQSLPALKAFVAAGKPDDTWPARHAVAMMTPKGPEQTAMLLEMLRQTGPLHHLWATLAYLRENKDPGSVQVLLEALKDTRNAEILPRIVDVLGEIGDRRAVEPLIQLGQSNPGDDVLLAVIGSLAELAGRHALPTIIQCTRKLKDSYSLKSAIRALARIGGDEVVPAIREIVQASRAIGVFEEGVQTLAKVGGDAAAMTLIDLFDHECARQEWQRGSKGSRQKVKGSEILAEALAKLTGQSFGPDAKAWRTWWPGRPATRPAASHPAH